MMLKIQNSKQLMLALLTFSSTTAITISPAAANISGRQASFDTDHQSTQLKISQGNIKDPDLELAEKMQAFGREFDAKMSNLQRQNTGDTPAARQQARNITREYFLKVMSVMTPAQRAQFKKNPNIARKMKEVGL